MYQLYTEFFMFLLIVVFLNPILELGVLTQRTIAILNTFAVFVIQPLFYLNGDVNFRSRVLNQGLWKAMKRELFDSNDELERII